MSDAYWAQCGTQAASQAGLGDGEGRGAEPIRQVGRWFERVHLLGLQSTPGVEVVVANEPLRTGGRTIGELDVLYRQAGRVVHREVAVKYYLAARAGAHHSAWVGPGKRDRLDLKLTRLATHQVTVARQARDLDAWPEDLPFPEVTEVLLLGAFFSPPAERRLPEGACTEAEHGHWYFASEFADRFGDAPWCTLDKPWWLSPEHARGLPTTPACELARGLRRPCLAAHVSSDVERAFVVPDGWWDDLDATARLR